VAVYPVATHPKHTRPKPRIRVPSTNNIFLHAEISEKHLQTNAGLQVGSKDPSQQTTQEGNRLQAQQVGSWQPFAPFLLPNRKDVGLLARSD
jgi:hypothetical protein